MSLLPHIAQTLVTKMQVINNTAESLNFLLVTLSRQLGSALASCAEGTGSTPGREILDLWRALCKWRSGGTAL